MSAQAGSEGATRRVAPTNPFVEFEERAIHQSLSDRFEEQVAKHADRLAVRTRHDELTYDALNRAANRVAHALPPMGEGGPEPIAVLLEHGAPVIIGIMGVLKAGGTYVPLDPAYPQARNAYILENSRCTSMVTNDENLALAEELAQGKLPLVNMDHLAPGLSDENLGLSIAPDGFAFILHTSGSTGKPKGVPQTHLNVLHEIMNLTNAAHICKDDRMVLISSCSFGDAVRTLFGALCNGASLHPLDVKKEGLTPLADWLIDQRVTIYRSVATAFRHFAAGLTGEKEFPSMRLVYLGGEPTYKEHVDLCRKHFPADCIQVNGLGSSESLTYRWFFMDRDIPITESNVPVGYPVKDMETLLLDEDRREVEPGEVGEIAVKSRYLSPGYLHRPDLTEARFLPDPDGGDARIYLTGDLGRMLPDGRLVHMGRTDFQVKIRGYRVDVSEVEMALTDMDAIKEAAVIALEDQLGDQRLVAYVVPAGEHRPTVTEMRSALAQVLPDYLIPSAYVTLDSLPLSPNGKVDRRALPAPGRERPALDTPLVAPRSPVEETLAEIWRGVLGLEEVGVHDSFLELGGHSLLAGQVISQVLDTFQVSVPLPELLRAPTVADMAVVITQRLAEKAGAAEMERLLAELEGNPD